LTSIAARGEIGGEPARAALPRLWFQLLRAPLAAFLRLVQWIASEATQRSASASRGLAPRVVRVENDDPIERSSVATEGLSSASLVREFTK